MHYRVRTYTAIFGLENKNKKVDGTSEGCRDVRKNGFQELVGDANEMMTMNDEEENRKLYDEKMKMWR